MCGIAGQISADPNKIAANYPAYCRMQKSLARRGPDQRGIYLHGHAALIHARLAVVDLENGCQPMVLDQGGRNTFWCTTASCTTRRSCTPSLRLWAIAL